MAPPRKRLGLGLRADRARPRIFDPPYEAGAPDVSWPPDILTWRTALSNALTQFLGVTGSAIQIDILHLDGDEAWLRLPRTQAKRFRAAVSGYLGDAADRRRVGFRTVGFSDFLMGLVGRKAEAALWAE